VGTSCESLNGVAFAGRRYLLLTEAFESNGIGCAPVVPETVTQPQRDACTMRAPDTECGYVANPDQPALPGKCRPVAGEANLACSQCVSICEDNFDGPLNAIKDKVGKIIATYCLDKDPACQVDAGDGEVRRCEGDEYDNPANYAIRVRMQCRLTEAEGGQCQDLLPPTILARTEWTLEFGQQINCPNSEYLIRLDDPPPAGAEIFVEFLVEVTGGDRGAGAGGAPAEMMDPPPVP
jgi:hypothetical protein